MIFISWKDSYVIGIDEIDRQHRTLVELLQRLYAAAVTKKLGREEISEALDELVRYAHTHFRTEEELFDRCKYPDRQSHAMEHRLFEEKVRHFQQEFEQGRLLVGDEILTFLRSWIDYHIMVVDKKYGPHLRTCLARTQQK